MLSPEETYEKALGYTINHDREEEPLQEGLTHDMLEELHFVAQDGTAKGVGKRSAT